MKTYSIVIGFIMLSLNFKAQTVVASGQEPAWILDWDGGKNFTFYQGENSFSYTLIINPEPIGSSKEISEAWTLKGENGKTATLVIEYFDPMSAESCPCFHDFGEGLNKGKAYFITENGSFYIGCADYLEESVTYEDRR